MKARARRRLATDRLPFRTDRGRVVFRGTTAEGFGVFAQIGSGVVWSDGLGFWKARA